MSDLRQRMIEDLQLRGMSARTQESYVQAVGQLVKYCKCSPDTISDEQLRQYFLYLKNEKKYSGSTSTVALCAIKFFFENTVKREWPTLSFVRAPRGHKLPVVLSREEVRRILASLTLARYRVCLTTIYSCGLRLQEGTRLQIPDIDGGRRLIHVHQGKGEKDRYVPLPITHPGVAARALEDASQQAVAFPGQRARRHRHADGHRTDATQQYPDRLQKSGPQRRRAQACLGPHACATPTRHICSKQASTCV